MFYTAHLAQHGFNFAKRSVMVNGFILFSRFLFYKLLVLSHTFPSDWIIGMTWATFFETDFFNLFMWCSIAHLAQQGFDFAKELTNEDWP